MFSDSGTPVDKVTVEGAFVFFNLSVSGNVCIAVFVEAYLLTSIIEESPITVAIFVPIFVLPPTGIFTRVSFLNPTPQFSE